MNYAEMILWADAIYCAGVQERLGTDSEHFFMVWHADLIQEFTRPGSLSTVQR